MKVRSATVADISVILDIARQSPTAAQWSEQRYWDAIIPTDESTQGLVLIGENEDDKNPTAFLVAREVTPEWELENIAVAPPARRLGIGKQLVNALLAHAQQTNSESIFLEVRESNLAARILYEHAGFEQVGRRKAYYAAPAEDAVLYRLSLK